MSQHSQVTDCRLAVDIGGTFTDVVLELSAHDSGRFTTKVLTTHHAPEEAVLDGIAQVLTEAGREPQNVSIVLHGTTLATNALIERKGALTAFVTTGGFRDILEMGFEKRFAQYNLDAQRPQPLVPRTRRFTVAERISAAGEVVEKLDTDAVKKVALEIQKAKVEAVAIGFMHAYAHPQHEQQAAAILSKALPGVSICLSSDVCPEMREYERFSTTVANAYVRPLISGYLQSLQEKLKLGGFNCPLFLMQSGGGLTTLEHACRLPIRLVESGPAGGAILAADVANARNIPAALAFDMGGTTAKIALIENGKPDRSRSFEIAREYRNMKGSGLPVRIPVIEMVEIGAGGGSIARIDAMRQLKVGPDSAGSDPGPACYAAGGSDPTVTDANVVLGKIDPAAFAGGKVKLDVIAAKEALQRVVGDPLELESDWSAAGVVEMVEENMANAARVHAVERGKEAAEYTMIAFGGGAPLHAARLARKLGIEKIVIPTGAGVGSAIGFLRAPVSYQLVKSYRCLLSATDLSALNNLLEDMATDALAVVKTGAGDAPVSVERLVELRYLGQGHELSVPLGNAALTAQDLVDIRKTFEQRYQQIYGLTMPESDVECVSWSVMATTPTQSSQSVSAIQENPITAPGVSRHVFDATSGQVIEHAVFKRSDLNSGDTFLGPAVVTEEETSTIVPKGFTLLVDAGGALVLSVLRSDGDVR